MIVLQVVTTDSTFSNIEITLLAKHFRLFFLGVFAVETSRCQCDFVFEKVVRFLQNTCEQYKNEIQSQDFLELFRNIPTFWMAVVRKEKWGFSSQE